jgi:hypothetical protein
MVVVGVTSHQGARESRVQGEGVQVRDREHGKDARCG